MEKIRPILYGVSDYAKIRHLVTVNNRLVLVFRGGDALLPEEV